MPQSLAQIYIHIIFSTKHRMSFINEGISSELYAYLGGTCKSLDCPPIKVGGHRDHVHILCKLSKKILLISLLEKVKKSSSKWMKTKGSQYLNFYWQDACLHVAVSARQGYAAFSVNPAEVDTVMNYIERQEEHHRNKTFQEECRRFFKKYNIDYDERYVWD